MKTINYKGKTYEIIEKAGCDGCAFDDNYEACPSARCTAIETATPTGYIFKLVEEPINDGSTANYYVLPKDAQELQDLIAFRDMNAQMGEIFRACYRYGQSHHSPRERDLKKIIFYAQAELARLEKYK